MKLFTIGFSGKNAKTFFELLKKSNCGIFTNKKKDNSADSIVLSLYPD